MRMLLALLLASSAALAAEHKVTGHGINEGNAFCRPLMLHLGGASTEMLPLLQMPAVEHAQIKLPQWNDLDAAKNAGIVTRIYGRVGPAGAKPPAGAKLQTARFDLDNDGKAEDVYRLRVEVRSSFPTSRSTVNYEAGTNGWLFDVAEKSDAGLVKDWPSIGANPIDAFIYRDKTRLMIWDHEDGRRKLSVATLAKDANAEGGNTEFLKYECGLNEFMR